MIKKKKLQNQGVRSAKMVVIKHHNPMKKYEHVIKI